MCAVHRQVAQQEMLSEDGEAILLFIIYITSVHKDYLKRLYVE
jgi:hypothetical protein